MCSIEDEQERLDHLQCVIEEQYFDHDREHLAESDKAWDAMHRALADGRLSWDGGDYPLNHVVLGGELLYHGDDYIMSLKTPAQVSDVAAALSQVTEQEFRRRYFAISARDYRMPLTEDDFAYTWAYFQDVRALFEQAASEGRYVLLTADQWCGRHRQEAALPTARTTGTITLL